MACVYDVSAQDRVRVSHLSTAAILRPECVIRNSVIRVRHTNGLKNFNDDPHAVGFQPVSGKVEASEGSGLGCAFTDKVLKSKDKVTVK